MNIANFLRTPILKNICERLLLSYVRRNPALHNIFQGSRLGLHDPLKAITRDHLFRTYVEFFEKRAFPHQGLRNASFSKKICVRSKLIIPKLV